MILKTPYIPLGNIPMSRHEVEVKLTIFKNALRVEKDIDNFEKIGAEIVEFLRNNTDSPLMRIEALSLLSLYREGSKNLEHEGSMLSLIKSMSMEH